MCIGCDGTSIGKIKTEYKVFCFKTFENEREIGKIFIQVLRDNRDKLKVATKNISQCHLPERCNQTVIDIIIKDRVIVDGEEVDGRFVPPNTILLNVSSLKETKKRWGLQVAQIWWLDRFLHECAHCITNDERKATEIATAWMNCRDI